MRPFFKDEGFNFQTEIALGATYHQAADRRGDRADHLPGASH